MSTSLTGNTIIFFSIINKNDLYLLSKRHFCESFGATSVSVRRFRCALVNTMAGGLFTKDVLFKISIFRRFKEKIT